MKLLKWIVINDQPFNIVENEEFKNMISFIRPGTQIPFANTIRRDLATNFKNVKENFQKELQVNGFFNIINK
jgi:hypothetical protein